ncbi:MAG: flagellar basal body rod protein FlgC [Dehalococcoidia bacterium]|jgi:flagellar basal-body rod protein FlgC|nr:flagellar basal body rod protein FlgC [Dehalococcoidia bacterium]
MSILGSLRIAGSSLFAQRLRMDVIANNVANVNSTRGEDGQPYRRQAVVFREQTAGASFNNILGRATGMTEAGGVEVTEIHRDTAAPRKVHDPTHPDADDEGYIYLPNVDVVTEMTDLVSATRAYQASTTVINATKSIAQSALGIGRG